MFNPTDATTGRGLLLFAIIMLVFGLFVGVVQQDWRNAIFLLALSAFMGCYGTIMLDKLPRFRRWLLVLGLVAGGIAFAIAVRLVLDT